MPYAPRATFDNPYGPQVSFRTEDVLPPAAYYLAPEDQVTVWVMVDQLPLTVSIQIRLLLPTGEMQLIPFTFSPTAALNWAPAFNVPPVEGYVLGALCWASNPQRGQCYVSVQVRRGAPPALNLAGEVLLQGYVSTINVLTYPSSPVESTFSGRGAFLTVQLPNTTGVDLVFNVPAYTLWRFCTLNFNFITSAAAASREVTIAVQDSNGVQVGVWQSAYNQAASLGYTYGFAPSGVNSSGLTWVNIAGPTSLFLPAHWSMRTQTFNLQSGDSFTGIAAQVEEWVGQ